MHVDLQDSDTYICKFIGPRITFYGNNLFILCEPAFCDKKDMIKKGLVQILVLPLKSSVTLNKLLNFSVFHIPVV